MLDDIFALAPLGVVAAVALVVPVVLTPVGLVLGAIAGIRRERRSA